MNNIKAIKLGAILGIFFALVSFLICLIYIIFGNLPTLLLLIIIAYLIFQVIVFIFSFFLYFNNSVSQKTIFIIGIMATFSFLVPGIIILINYFKQKKQNLLMKK